MHRIKNAALLLLASLGVYAWLSAPSLRPYSLQLFALLLLSFFISWHINRKKGTAPGFTNREVEMLALHSALLLLVGNTGGVLSPLFPLAYAHIFILVLSLSALTTGASMVGMLLFYYLLHPTLPLQQLASLLFIPAMWLIFTFAKRQQEELQAEKQLRLAQQEQLKTLDQAETTLELFLASFVQPKLRLFEEQFLEARVHETLHSQLSLLQSEVDKMLRKMQQLTDEKT